MNDQNGGYYYKEDEEKKQLPGSCGWYAVHTQHWDQTVVNGTHCPTELIVAVRFQTTFNSIGTFNAHS